MLEILDFIQEQYVPLIRNKDGSIEDIVKPISFGGDLLSEERAINAQKGFLENKTDYLALKGLEPQFEDWHLKRTLFEVNPFQILF